MVARILEDSRYTGERGYPPVIDREALEKALKAKRKTDGSSQNGHAEASAASAGGHQQRTWSGRCWICSTA